MPITLPNLDDRSFDGLVAAAKRMIPGLAPSWTDHNPSDPGITLVEIFAFIAEMHSYRADRISEANKQAFVRLLRGDPAWRFTKAIDEEIRDAVLNLRSEERAVTAEDFRTLAEGWVRHPASGGPDYRPVARAHCLPGCNADASPREFHSPAHVSLLILPASGEDQPVADDDLIGSLKEYLAPRCLLTTRLHVAGPRYLKLRVRVTVQIFADRSEAKARGKIERRLQEFFHPLEGGGWPFGRAVYLSDLYAMLDRIEDVDYAGATTGEPVLKVLTAEVGDRAIMAEDSFVGIRLEPDELVSLAPFPEQGRPDAADSWIVVERYIAILPEE
jgi:hypothetical protein